MADWLTYTHQDLTILLKYPNPTPLGNSVSINERSGPASFRVHFVSERSNEVYFEAGRYLDLPAKQALDDFLKDVTGRIENLEVGEVEEIRYANSPARRFSIRWPGKERVILFVERDDALYRIIHDPASLLNQQMLESVEFQTSG